MDRVTRTSPTNAGRSADVLAMCGLFLAGFLVVIPALVGHGFLGHHPGDATRIHYFMREYLMASLAEWRLPLWNPYTQLGTPFFVNMQWTVFYPVNLLLLGLPAPVAYNAFIGLHLGIAAIGMYLLGRDWGLSRAAAVIAGLAYGLNGRFIAYAWGGFIMVLSAAVWLPLVLLAFSRALGARSTAFLWLLAATALVGLEMVAGHPQDTVFTMLVLFLAAVWEAGKRYGRCGLSTMALAPLSLWGIVAVGGVALGAVQFVPTYQAAALSTRSFAWTLRWSPEPLMGSYNPIRFVTWVMPDVFGSPVSHRPASTDWLSMVLREAHSNEFQMYIGLLPLALAIVAIATWRSDDRIRFLCVAVGLAALLALGHFTPLYGLMNAIVPPLRTFRIPARFLMIVSFGLALLAGFGADHVLTAPPHRLRRLARYLAALAVLFGVGVGGSWIVRGPMVDWGHRLSAPVFTERLGGARLNADDRQALVEKAYTVAQGSLARTAALVGASALAFFIAAALGRRWMLAPLLIGIAALDLGLHALGYAEFERMTELTRENRPLLDIVEHRDMQARVLVVNPAPPLPSLDLIRPSENVFIYHRLLSAGGYDSFELATYRNTIDVVMDDLRAGSSFVASIFGVRFVVTQLALPGGELRRVGTLGSGTTSATIYENDRALPRFYLRPSARRVADAQSALAMIKMRQLRVGQEVLVEGDVPASDIDVRPDTARLNVTAASPGHVVLTVAGDRPAWLVDNEAYFPGVVATIDDRPVAVYRANGLVRALRVPPGEHRIEIAFRPQTLRDGAWVTLTSIVVIMILAGWSAGCHRRRMREAEERGA